MIANAEEPVLRKLRAKLANKAAVDENEPVGLWRPNTLCMANAQCIVVLQDNHALPSHASR